MKLTDNYCFFTDGPLSEKSEARFHYNGYDFQSAYQFRLYQTALYLDLPDLSKRILQTKSIKELDELSKSIDFMDPKVRDKRFSIVFLANLNKFQQNPYLMKELLSTKSLTLVFVNDGKTNYEKEWGINLPIHSSDIDNPLNWSGENLLGFVLTLVRNKIHTDSSIRNKRNQFDYWI
jgi:ribA/ribD-fused uncharacterized protein